MSSASYQVLARKYRPGNFSELLGQDGLVQTLQNSIRLGRVAHAFILTGVRGVGKTTTARIIAKALNCDTGSGEGAVVSEPCNKCESCLAISGDRHLDVRELDAASHTGIDDMRDLIEKAGYKPAMGRYKVYILDEVHMLSKSAFNGLLKTLEEPPPQVIFILATTDIDKVPVTILSRCQRFDLARVSIEVLQTHFANICKAEGLTISDSALHLLARHAEGSVRDGLSLLEQVASMSGGDIEVDVIRRMLGLADRELLLDLFDNILSGNVVAVLDKVSELDILGVDSLQIIKDLLDLDYGLTRLKLVPQAQSDTSLSELERQRGKEMADKLSVAVLSRIWQVLFKGFGEVKLADNRRQALEMVLVRLLYLSQTPTPDELMKSLPAEGVSVSVPSAVAKPQESEAKTDETPPWEEEQKLAKKTEAKKAEAKKAEAKKAEVKKADENKDDENKDDENKDDENKDDEKLAENVEKKTLADGDADSEGADSGSVDSGSADSEGGAYSNLRKIKELLQGSKEFTLSTLVNNDLHLVELVPPLLRVRVRKGADEGKLIDLQRFLSSHSGLSWEVLVANDSGDLTLREQVDLEYKERLEKAADDSIVREVRKHFPGSTIASLELREEGYESHE